MANRETRSARWTVQALSCIGVVVLSGSMLSAGCSLVLGIDELEYRSDGGLLNRGLVARYHIDEAGTDDQPTMLRDSSGDAPALTLNYNGGWEFVEPGGQWAITWTDPGTQGGAQASINGTRMYDQLNESFDATIELVLTVDGVASTSRFLTISGTDAEDVLSLTSDDNGHLMVWQQGVVTGVWEDFFGNLASQRLVVHVVLDTTLDNPDERVKLYVDGALVPPTGSNPPAQNQPIDLGEAQLVLGNGPGDADESFAGRLFYAALYNRNLRSDSVQLNYEILSERDDPVPAPEM